MCSMYSSMYSANDADDFPIRFGCNKDYRQREVTLNKTVKGKYLVEPMLRDVFGFPELQKVYTYSLGYTSTMNRNNDSVVLNHAAVTTNAKTVIRVFFGIRHNTHQVVKSKVKSLAVFG